MSSGSTSSVGLAGQRTQRVSTLSTGQRQAMKSARGLLNDPWILFLDEPTLGLDVSAARAVREIAVAWKRAVPGRTVLLTTHYMAEADELCERIAIVDRGRILAIGTPAELRQRVQRESIFRLELDRLDGGPAVLARLPGVLRAVSATDDARDGTGEARQFVVVNLVLHEDAVLGGVVGALGGLGAQILALRKSEPTLEDVLVELGIPFDPGRGALPRHRCCLPARRPAIRRPAGRAPDMPFTWWLAAVRLALFPDGPSSLAGTGTAWAALAGPVPPDAGQTLLALLVTGAIPMLAAAMVFRASARRAKDRGLLDQTTGT